MKKRIIIIFFLCTASFGAKKPSTTLPTDQCVTAECHVTVKNYKVLHGPVVNNACDACHELTSARDHKYKLLRTKAELCTYCHEFSVKRMPVVHKPVEEGECLGCHDPHGGGTHSLTLEKSMTDLCGRCHESVTRSMKVLHTPVAKGACDSCHSPHASRFPKLLDVIGTDLCLTCHTDISAQLAMSPSRHKALEQGCQKCHNAHGSSFAKSTTQPIVQQCSNCHEATIALANQATNKHSVVFADRACLTCHNAHAGKAGKLLIDQPVKICMDCHTDKIKNAVAGVPEIVDPKLIKHGPISDGKCEGCHGAHGTDLPALLTKAYQATNYQHVSVKTVELCFTCHDAKMIQTQTTAKLTAFRNGDRNLHYVHITQTKNDRSCAICHATHAATNDRLIRDIVQVKKWRMPIAFTRTRAGGSCRPGCHGQFGYDRDHPFPTSAPASQPAQFARALDVTPKIVEFTATDSHGAEIHVPRADCRTILALVRPDDPYTRDLLAHLASAVEGQRNLQVIVVSASATNLESPTRRVIADPANSLSSELEVHAWPIVLVIDRDGLELARVSDSSPMLRERLQSYLTGVGPRKIAAAVTQPTTTPSTTRAARLLRLAEGLLNQNKADQAMKLLEEALRLQPQSTNVNLAIIRAEIQLSHGYEALSILRQIPADELPADRRGLLEGEIFMRLEKWEDAKRLLTAVAVNKSESRRVHQLLAQIYEHQKDWQRAAMEYRAANQATEE